MLDEYLQNTLFFLQTNQTAAIVIGVAVVALFYFKTKEMFKLVAFCFFMAIVFYLITLLAGTLNTGAKQKDQMIYKSKEALGE